MRCLRFVPVLMCLVASLCLAPLAFAHAHDVSSEPASGAELASLPPSISITFDDDLDPNATAITVLGPGGQAVQFGKTVVSTQATKVAAVSINPGGNGTYTVKWHAVADDDKGVTDGMFTFRVGAATTATAAAPAPSTGAAITTTAPSALPASGGGWIARQQEQTQTLLALAVMMAMAAIGAVGRAFTQRVR